MMLLKNKLIHSQESLTELNNLLNKITVCGEPAGTETDKNIFMTEAINLKSEARKLLDEVNQYFERSPNGNKIFSSNYDSNIFEQPSFKERLNILKQKINAVSQKTHFK